MPIIFSITCLKKKSNLNGSKSDPTRKPLCHVQKEMPEETDRFRGVLSSASWILADRFLHAVTMDRVRAL